MEIQMNKLHDQSTPEEISTYLNDLIPKAKEKKDSYLNEDQDSIESAISHPNLNQENFNKIYENFSSPEDLMHHYKITRALTDHPSWTLNHANTVINNSSQSEDIPYSLIQHLTEKHSNLDLSPLEQRILKDIDDDSHEASSIPHYESMNLNPNFYLNILKTKPQHSYGENLSEEQNKVNKKALKHSIIGLEGAIKTQKHTPESLKETLNLLMDKEINKIPTSKYYGFSYETEDDQFDYLTDFVNNQKGLTKDQLNLIYQKALERPTTDISNWRNNELPTAILEHENVDPMLLAKTARSSKESYHDSKISSALRNPKLPHEVIDAILQNDEELSEKNYGLSKNPALTKEHLNHLLDKGYGRQAIVHENADDELHKKFWENTNKTTEDANDILSSDKVPAEILKELVGHKNKNVAIKALHHENADKEVVQAGLNRKMKDVQDAARKHPLVANQELKKGFLEGKVKLSSILTKKQESEHFNKLTPEEKAHAYEKISEKLKGTNIEEIKDKSKEDIEHIFKLKYHLASSPDVPEHIKTQNAEDIVEAFKVPHNFTDFSFRSSQPDSYDSFNNLIKDGNKKAEDSALNKIGYLLNLNTHFKNEKDKSSLSSRFLNKAFEKIQNSKNQTVLNRFGIPQPIEENQILENLKNISQFPNLSEENFEKYINKDFGPASAKYLKSEWDAKNGTILDSRYGNLSDEEKAEKFSKYLTPKHAFAVAASGTAPQDLKDKAFEMLTPDEKHDLVVDRSNHLVGFSSEILKNALFGKYNYPDESITYTEKLKNKDFTSYEKNALKLLDNNNEEDKNTLDSYLNHLKDQQRPSDHNISHYLNLNWLRNNSDIFKKHAHSYPNLYLDSINETIYKKVNHKKISQDEALDFLKKEANDFVAGSSNPQESAHQFWENVLENYDQTKNNAIGEILGHNYKMQNTNGKLDFLVELGKENKQIKNLLLSKNILSESKKEELRNTFSNFGEYLDSLDTSTRDKIMSTTLDSWKNGKIFPKKQDVEHFLDRATPESLTGEILYRNIRLNTSLAASYVEKVKFLSNLIDQHSLSTEHHSDLIMNSLRPLSQKNKDLVGNLLVEDVLNTPNSPDKIKTFYKETNQIATLSAKTLGKLGDFAAKANDINFLVKLYKNDNAPKSLSTKITKIIENSKELDPQNIINISDLYSHPQFTLSSIKKTNAAFENSIQLHSQSDEETSVLKNEYLDKISQSFSDADQGKAGFFASILQKYATFPETKERSNKILSRSLKMESLSEKDKKSIYLNLPEDQYISAQSLPILSENLVNDEEILEKSTSGWRFNSLINSIENMNSNTVSVLVNRIVTSDNTESFKDLGSKLETIYGKFKGKDFVLSKLMQNSATKHQDLTKLIRALPEKDINNYINLNKDNFLETHVSPLLDHLSEKLSDVSKNPNKYSEIVDSQSLIDSLSSKIETMSTIFWGSSLEDDMVGQKETFNSYSNAIKSICDAGHKILDLNIGDLENEQNINSVFRAIDGIQSAKMPINGEDLSNTFSVTKKLQEKMPGQEDKLLPTYTRLIEKSENVNPEVWQKISNEHPEYPYMLFQTSISSEMLNPINIKSALDENTPDFCRQLTNWFEKMDNEALKAHGPKIMDALITKSDPKEQMPMYLSNAIHQGLRLGSRFMNAESVKNILKKLPSLEKRVAEDICIENGTGGQDLINDLFDKSLKEGGLFDLEYSGKFLDSPFITDKMAEKALNSFEENSFELNKVIGRLIDNKHISNKTADYLANKITENFNKLENKKLVNDLENKKLVNDISKNPKISYQSIKNIFSLTVKENSFTFSSGSRFPSVFLNPIHGSKLLREMPPSIPPKMESYGISANKMQRDILAESKSKEKIYEVIKNIPLDGITWPEFKRKFPKYENLQEVKSVFMSKNNKPAIPEDFTHLLAQADEKDKFNSFHVTFSDWDGMQRHNNKNPNLVVQINTSQKADNELSKDPKTWALYQFILKHSNGIEGQDVGLHPTTPHLIAWSRVDVSNKDAWIIEEIQSDVAQKFRKNIKYLLQNSPSGLKLDDVIVTSEEIKKHMSKIDEAFANWQKASIEAVLQNAKAHGIKKVYIHGHGIRSEMSGGGRVNGIYASYSKKHINPRIVEIYDGMPEKYGFKKCDYTDYPNYNPKLLSKVKKLGLPSHCWYLDLP
jgi:hypothetical protein